MKHKYEINEKKTDLIAVKAYSQMLEKQDWKRGKELEDRK